MNRWQQTDRTEEIIKNRIAANVPESKIVNKKIDKAYEKIRAMQAAAETASGRQSAQNAHRQTNKRTGGPAGTTAKSGGSSKGKTAARYTTAAALFLAAVLFLMKNPALAAQLPFIGHIFKELEQEVSYPGDYSENAITLADETESADNGQAREENQGQKNAPSSYQATSGGVTVTLSEMTYDSNAIYLALLIENQNGFAADAQSHDSMYLECRTDMYKADNTKETFSDEYGNSLAYMTEGTFTDSHTFKGLVQLTGSGLRLSDYTGCDITFLKFIQELSTGTKLTDTLPGETETVSYIEYDRQTYDGPWTFHLDFTDARDMERETPVNKTNDQGFGIEKVVKTEYELYAEPILPAGAEPADYVVTIWDADGKPLESHGNSLEIRSIYGRDVSRVTIYILTWDDFVECKGTNSYRQPEKAVFEITVDLTK